MPCAVDLESRGRADCIAMHGASRETIVKHAVLVRSIAALALFGAGWCAGLVAQPNSDSPFRKEQKRADLSGAQNMEVIASIVEIKPGEASDLHLHHGVEVAYVIQGAMVQPPGKDPVMNPTGATVLNLRDAKHGAFKVVGDTPLKLLTVHIVDKDKPLYDYQK
jgi:quercetin dioxygenase-like cupin family protein